MEIGLPDDKIEEIIKTVKEKIDKKSISNNTFFVINLLFISYILILGDIWI